MRQTNFGFQCYSPSVGGTQSKRRFGTCKKSMDSERLESIENLYTLKKVQSRVRDKLVPWLDFQTTGSRNHQPTSSVHSLT